VKGVPQWLNAFVSRLASDTTEETSTSWLAYSQRWMCKMGVSFIMRSLRCLANINMATVFYNKVNWPEGAVTGLNVSKCERLLNRG